MQMISTIVSRSDLALLQNALLSFGRIVTFAQLYSLMSDVTRGNAKKKMSLLVEKGWLVRLRNGLYVVVTDISALGTIDLSEYVIAQALHEQSYISFENALQYHAMYDQALMTVRSVTTTFTRNYQVQDREYLYSHLRDDLYFGFQEEVVDKSYRVNIAEAEKALLDMLYLRATSHTASLVLEKLREYSNRLDMDKLQHYAMRYGIGMMRIVGFLLDQIEVDTDELLGHTKTHRGTYSKLTNEAETFNAKWRLYYDNHLIA